MNDYTFEQIKEQLFSPCILDILDDLGYRNQGMNYQVRPLVVNNQKIMGRAYTLLACEVYAIPQHPFQMELKAIDELQKGDVLVGTTGGSMCAAFFGELMATRCSYRGAVGAVIDGAARDTAFIEKMGFPLFCRGISPLDSKGRMDVIAHQVPIAAGGVLVHPGDIIYADRDGVAVIPAGVLDKVVEMTLKKLSMENIVREEIKNGVSATDVYAKYGVL
jgi:regulator of RNase E activity RraA